VPNSSAISPKRPTFRDRLYAVRYRETDFAEWNDFVARAKNGHFIFDRGYMDYHRDRFPDHSLLVRDSCGTLRAVMPATIKSGTPDSHGGLSFGGLIYDRAIGTTEATEAFWSIIDYLRFEGFSSLIYRPVPTIYHQHPAEEDRYALARHEARLLHRDVSSVIDYSQPVRYQERRRRCIRKAEHAGLTIEEATDFQPFWEILTENLWKKYRVKPVHSVEEIQLLHGRFPKQIVLYQACRAEKVVGGVVLYLTPTVAHSQYTANNEEGRRSGSLDLLFDQLIQRFASSNKRFFDFGVSTERDGTLNEGLVEFKESFGSRTVCFDRYEVPL
jgi:hypothetical protein